MPASYSWTLVPDPTTTPPDAAETAGAQAASVTARGLPSFLGRGLLHPFRRDAKNDFANAEGVTLVVAAVKQVIGTKADTVKSPGELPWDTSFGSRAHMMRHQNNPAFATVLVAEALQRWEPRAANPRALLRPNPLNQRERILEVRFDVTDRGGRTLLADQVTSVAIS